MKIIILGAEGVTGQGIIYYINNQTEYSYEAYDYSVINEDTKFINLESEGSIDKILKKEDIDIVINCVGSFTNDFWKDFKLNVQCTRNLLESVNRVNKNIRVVLLGSSAEYGVPVSIEGSIAEDNPLNPINNYGLTKKIQFDLFNFYIKNYDLDLIYLRPFNLVSKKLKPNLFIGNLYKQIDLYNKNMISEIKLGYLGNYRDYLNIEDASRLYIDLAIMANKGSIINVGSGKAIMIKELLESILRKEGLKMDIVRFEVNPGYYEVKYLYANIESMQKIIQKDILVVKD